MGREYDTKRRDSMERVVESYSTLQGRQLRRIREDARIKEFSSEELVQ